MKVMDCRCATLVCILVAAFACLIPDAESYPELFVYLHSRSCSDIPQQSYAGHGAPTMDSGVAFEVINTRGQTVASLANGQEYDVTITFTTPRHALVSASKGELFHKKKLTPGYRDCRNRLVFSPAAGFDGPMATLTMGLWVPDTATGSSVTLTVVSASSEVSPFMIATLTMPMSSSSAQSAPSEPPQQTTKVQPASVTAPGPTPTPQVIRPTPAVKAVRRAPTPATPAVHPAAPIRPVPHPAPALPLTPEPPRASQVVRPAPALQTVRVAVQQAMASLPPTVAQPAPQAAAMATVTSATPAPAPPVPAMAAAPAAAATDAMEQTVQILTGALHRLKHDEQQKKTEAAQAAAATAAGIVQQALQGKGRLISAGMQKLQKPLFISAVLLDIAEVPAKKSA